MNWIFVFTTFLLNVYYPSPIKMLSLYSVSGKIKIR